MDDFFSLDSIGVLLMIGLKQCVLRRKSIGVKCHFHHLISKAPALSVAYLALLLLTAFLAAVHLGHPDGVVFIGLFHCRVALL